MIGWSLLVSEPEWALRYLTRAAKAEPENSWGQYLLGAALYNSKRFEQAQVHYLNAAENKARRQASLQQLSAMWLYDAGLEPKQAAAKAKPFVDRLRSEYPDDVRGMILSMDMQAGVNDGRLDIESLKRFLKVVDRRDPVQKHYAEQVEAAFKEAGIK